MAPSKPSAQAGGKKWLCCVDQDGKSPNGSTPPNNPRMLELLDALTMIVDEMKVECGQGSYQVQSLDVARLQQAMKQPEGQVEVELLVGSEANEYQDVQVDEDEGFDSDKGEGSQDGDRPSILSDTDTAMRDSEMRNMESGSRYRPSLLKKSNSMLSEDNTLDFQDAWSEMPAGADKDSTKKLEQLNSFGSKLSSMSQLSGASANEDRCLVYPSSTRKLMWDILGLCFIGAELVMLPLQLFSEKDKSTTTYFCLNVLGLMYWGTDIGVSFITAYFTSNGDLEKRKPLIARNYVRSWFTIDLICVLVDFLGLVAQSLKSGSGFVRMVKILKFFRMIRIFKVNSRMTTTEGRIRSEVTLITVRIGKLLAILFFTCHCMACGWWAVGKYYTRSRHNWIDDALPAKEDEETGSIRERSFGYRYSVCFHWALSQFVASSEIFPTNTAERAYAVFSGALALVGFGAMISGMTSSIVEISEKRNQDTKDELKLRTFMVQHDISSKLRSQVWSYLRASKRQHVKTLQSKEVGLLQNMPRTMVQDICVQIYVPQVSIHPVFGCLSVICNRSIKKLANSAMQEHALGLGAELFLIGEASTEMYFITKGVMWYNFMSHEGSAMLGAPPGESVKKVRVAPNSDVSWASELALYVKWRHNGIMEASEVCELIKMSSTEFTKIFKSEVIVHRYVRSLLDLLKKYPGQQSDVMISDIVNQAFEESRY